MDPRAPMQCFGQEASRQAAALLMGQNVLLEANPSQGEWDAYDRLLRYVWLEDGRLFNLEMIGGTRQPDLEQQRARPGGAV